MVDITCIAETARLIAEEARANMLFALKAEGRLSATELAAVAGVAPSTASGHLAQMVEAGLVTVIRTGRMRLYALASAEVSDMLEAVEGLAGQLSPPRAVQLLEDPAIRRGRCCYDHLAGEIAVSLTRAMLRLGYLIDASDGFRLSPGGVDALAELGLDMERLRAGRRRLVRRCPDWSARSVHIGGAVGAALFARFSALGWLRREPGSRAVAITRRGAPALARVFDLPEGLVLAD